MNAFEFAAAPLLETPRLVLDAHRLYDFAAMSEMWADPEVVRHISGQPSTLQESWFRLLRYRGLWSLLGYGYWAVRERQTGRFMGDVGFADLRRMIEPSIAGLPEAGWVLAGWAHGQGFATEAVAAALAWLDGSSRHRSTVCLIENAHPASLRVAFKNGFGSARPVTRGMNEVVLLTRDT